MSPSAVLFSAELRRIKRLGVSQPLVSLLFLLGYSALLFRAADSGRFVGSGGSTQPITLIVSGLIAGSILFGLMMGGLVSRFDTLDLQIQASPVSDRQGFLGCTCFPLLTGWTILSLPLALLVYGIYASLGIRFGWAWSLIFLGFCIVAAGMGGILAEITRIQMSLQRASLILALVVSQVGLSLVLRDITDSSEFWVFPIFTASVPGGFSLPIASIVLLAEAAVVFAIWLMLGVDRRKKVPDSTFVSRRMGWSTFTSVAFWLTLSAMRDRRLRKNVTSVVLFGLLLSIGLRVFLKEKAIVLGPLLALLLTILGTSLVLPLSSYLTSGGWLWKSSATRRIEIMGAYWLTSSSLAIFFAILAGSVSLIIRRDEEILRLIGTLTLWIATVGSAAGRILPWQERSPLTQVGASLLHFIVGFGALEVGARIGDLIPGLFGVLAGVSAIAVLTLAVCYWWPSKSIAA